MKHLSSFQFFVWTRTFEFTSIMNASLGCLTRTFQNFSTSHTTCAPLLMLMFLRFFKPSLILRVASVFFLAMLMLLRHILSGILSIKTHHQIGTCFSTKSTLPHLVFHQFLLLLQHGMGVYFGDFRIFILEIWWLWHIFFQSSYELHWILFWSPSGDENPLKKTKKDCLLGLVN